MGTAGTWAYGVLVGLSAWSVICMVFAMIVDRRPMVGTNWRGLLWPPAYLAWRRRYLDEHPGLRQLWEDE